MPLSDLISSLQLAIGPVILISGVGLLLLTMTNRLGRVIDRARDLTPHLDSATPDVREAYLAQLRILWRRARLERAAIALATLSVLFVALLIITMFVGTLNGLDVSQPIVGQFTACMLSLVFSLAFFLSDVNLTLRALDVELPAEARQAL